MNPSTKLLTSIASEAWNNLPYDIKNAVFLDDFKFKFRCIFVFLVSFFCLFMMLQFYQDFIEKKSLLSELS